MPSPYEFSHPFDHTPEGQAAIEGRTKRQQQLFQQGRQLGEEWDRLEREAAANAHILDCDGDLFPEYAANAWTDMSAEEWAQRCTESTDSGSRP